MLQQTQVKTVLPRYAAWFEHFPTLASLAQSHVDDVLKQWEGLGYYRRARLLHTAAQRIQHEFNGVFPSNFKDILSLPGIGRSTAGAIASFAWQQATPVLDANVKRVIQAWENRALTSPEWWRLAEEYIIQNGQPDLWNQAMMELGATVCQAKIHRCEICPMSAQCQSAFLPIAVVKKENKSKDVYWQVHLLHNEQQHIWLSQRPDTGIWAGLWTPPISELKRPPKPTPDLIHQLTHRRIHLYLDESQSFIPSQGCWVPSWEGYAIPTGIHRLLAQCKWGE